MQNLFDFALATPEIVLLVLTGAVLLIDAFGNEPSRRMTFMLTMGTLLVVILVSWGQWGEATQGRTFSSLYVADSLGHFLKILSAIAVGVTLIYGRAYAEKRDMVARGGEMYSLALLTLLGEFVMISAGSMLTVYLGVELMSFALYGLVALRRDHLASVEAAMKYYVLGCLASGILLYGMSMIYGATGQLGLAEIAQVIREGGADRMPLVFGVVFIVSGLAFKLTAAPFHMWTPDVYQGAPTTVTLLVGSAPKFAAFVITLRLLIEALHGIAVDWQPMLLILAVLSLAIGNIVAIAQTNFKRMLAYSTIGQMGFVFLGLLSGVYEGQAGASAAAYGSSLFYVVIYVLTTLSTFGLILLLTIAWSAPQLLPGALLGTLLGPLTARLVREPQADIDGGDDAAAQVQRSGDLRRGQRDAGDPLMAQHVLHLKDRDAEHLIGDRHGHKVLVAGDDDVVAPRLPDGGRQLGVAHAAPFCSVSVCCSAKSSASRSNLAT